MTTEETILIPSADAMPFGLLSNQAILPMQVGDHHISSADHFIMSSMLEDPHQVAMVLSYPSIQDARDAFNKLDEKRYMELLTDACRVFHEKKVRSTRILDGNKTVGAACRDLLGEISNILYLSPPALPKIVGGIRVKDDFVAGYNIVPHSLMRMKRILQGVDIPEGLEMVFWRMHPEGADIPQLTKFELSKVYKETRPEKTRQIPPPAIQQPPSPPRARPHKRPTKTSNVFIDVVNDEEQDEDEDFLADLVMSGEKEDDDDQSDRMTEYGEQDDEEGEEDDVVADEPAFNPVVPVPIGNNRKVRWVPTHIGPLIDDLREFDVEVERLYTKVALPTDPLAKTDPLEIRTDPMTVFKIFKAAEYLVWYMRNGNDILRFMDMPIDAILYNGGILPEVFAANKVDEPMRRIIFRECWDRFRNKTLSYYEFVEKEILYPGNLVMFIRKAYASKLNDYIGEKIKNILFQAFLHQIIDDHYSNVAPEMKTLAMVREWRGFSRAEFETITNDLYHLFFSNKFVIPDEDKLRVWATESQRLSAEEINVAIQSVPVTVIASNSQDITGTVLDPMTKVKVVIEGKEFHDLLQYIYYRLFIVYGGVKPSQAYEHLRQRGMLLDGDNPLLQERLNIMVVAARNKITEEALRLKLARYPQVEEMLLYLRATGQDFEFANQSDADTPQVWSRIQLPMDKMERMKWVVKFIPEDLPNHFERCIFMYFFMEDMIRSLRLFRELLGEKLKNKTTKSFLHCFYKHLLVITEGEDMDAVMPDAYYDAVKSLMNRKDADFLWSKTFPFLQKFTEETMVPSQLFDQAKKMSRASKEDSLKALVNVLKCVYEDMEAVTTDNLYTIVKIISGRDNIATWREPITEMIMEREESNMPPMSHILPKKIRDKLPVRKGKKAVKKLVKVFHVHPDVDTTLLLTELGRTSVQDPVVARVSHAVACLHKKMLHPRRIMFYL